MLYHQYPWKEHILNHELFYHFQKRQSIKEKKKTHRLLDMCTIHCNCNRMIYFFFSWSFLCFRYFFMRRTHRINQDGEKGKEKQLKWTCNTVFVCQFEHQHFCALFV